MTAPVTEGTSVVFTLPDDSHDLAGVRLLPALSMEPPAPEFAEVGGGWRLELNRPPVGRMEYRFQLRHRDGGLEEICDPGNPLRAPGAFGDKSVVEFPGYVRPRWLEDTLAGLPGGATTYLTVPAPELGRNVEVRLWEPPGPSGELPLLMAHDGPEYDRLSELTTYAAAMIADGRVKRHRVALLQPGERNEEYSANPAYTRALVKAVLPAITARAPMRGRPVGMGASLGGLAMLHAHRRNPDLFGGLFLQSASFLDRRLDPQEAKRFDRFPRVSRFTTDTVRQLGRAAPIPITLTCGTAEENLFNNRQMADALRAQGYPVRLVEIPDAHNYVAWRDAFDPALTDLLAGVWS